MIQLEPASADVPAFAYAVLIGRFQPFHAGHEKLLEYALSIAPRVIVVIGSDKQHRSVTA